VRVLIVADGLEPLLHHTVVGLADRGHRVTVVGLHSSEELDPVERFRLAGAVRTHGGSAGRLGRALLAVLGRRADVTYFEAAYVAANFAPVLGRLGPKLVMCTGSDVRIMPGQKARLASALPAVFGQMGRILCRSEDLRRNAVRLGAPEWRTRVVHPAADMRIFTPTDRPARGDATLRLVSVGRQHWVKDYENAVAAVALSRRTGHDVTLTIVGSDRGTGEGLRFAIADLGLEDAVRLSPAKPQAGVRAALARADAFLLSSVSEGMSRAAIEAMAMGLPVIATDVGGMPELVSDGVDGLLVPARDPRALAEAIALLAGDPSRRKAMGLAALRRAAEFDADRHLDRIEGFLIETAAA